MAGDVDQFGFGRCRGVWPFSSCEFESIQKGGGKFEISHSRQALG